MYEVICNFVKSALNYWQIKRNVFVVRPEFLCLNRVRVVQLCMDTLTKVERKKQTNKQRRNKERKERKKIKTDRKKKERKEERRKERKKGNKILIFVIFLTLHRSPLCYILHTGLTMSRFAS